ncbi:hypothetical protein HOY82DRAFT_410843 [Tuber indicum]|nr:hypothetical protein HOY82DRAFT_410843 [Tuber indicum]
MTVPKSLPFPLPPLPGEILATDQPNKRASVPVPRGRRGYPKIRSREFVLVLALVPSTRVWALIYAQTFYHTSILRIPVFLFFFLFFFLPGTRNPESLQPISTVP